MKKIIVASIMMLMMTLVSVTNAQTFKASDFKKSSTKEVVDTTTTFKYEVGNRVYNVFRSKSGALYFYTVATKGKHKGELVKRYLPKDVQIAMGRKYDK